MTKHAALPRGGDHYRDILENIAEGYFEVDLGGTFTLLNPSMAKILGYNQKELVGVNYKDYLSEENVGSILQAFKKAYRAGGSAVLHDGRHVRKDGSVLELETSVALLKDEQNRPRGFRGIVRDITERKRLVRQVLQMHKMEAIGTLAGGIAHDFNNLLMGIQGFASLIRSDLEPDHAHYKKLLQIEDQVRSGAELTQQLLGFAREGQYEVKLVDLADILKRTAAMFGRTKKEITIHRNADKALWHVEADQGQIEQVLLGIYLNAWQAMPGGGTLTLEARNTVLEEGESLPFEAPPGPYVRVSIRDTGVGMDEKTVDRVFEPFFTTKEMGHGAGLGLASAYGIIKSHGGFISVASKVGEGTTFDLYLPASREKAAPVAERPETIVQGRETILLIDDEDVIIEVSREILEMLGYRVWAVRTGQEAIALYKSRKKEIDLVILDMIMPGMSGGDTFDHLKALNPAIKVILSTGYSLTGQAREIMARGCRGFIQKPYKIERLSQKVREVLESPESQ
ncbi:MAG: hybrid sensor histidine kinase/response regulator [Syntrophus sp. (in: bacteria)]|nr:hybrid sensor histidine kinase/response regulator [Syntrophus sp. (in: bacteria)]